MSLFFFSIFLVSNGSVEEYVFDFKIGIKVCGLNFVGFSLFLVEWYLCDKSYIYIFCYFVKS